MIALIFAGAFGLAFSLFLTPVFAKMFRRMNLGQYIRADTPTSHQLKRGTPSMGGVVFIAAATLGYFLAKLLSQQLPSVPALLVIMMMVGLGLIGFLDDWLKVRRSNSLGLNHWFKILGQLIVGAAFAILALGYQDSNGTTAATTAISLFRDLDFDFVVTFGVVLGIALFVVWIVLLTVSVSNAVNLTDGLDGLAGGASIFAIGSYIIIGFWQANQSCFNVNLDPAVMEKCYIVSSPLDLAVIAAAIVGALVGFLWWNTSPAQIMMGDTGALGLGGALTALAVMSRTELLLVLLGGLFVWITMTVIIQRIYFKATKGKRIWLSTPIHHHFELKGWQEVTIVVRFWIIQGMCVALGVGLFYLEWTSI
ncbi:MAG: phospho-N-acetylmuramoyl-pentapeptide-transferase [Microbacteriaceae bacterium]